MKQINLNCRGCVCFMLHVSYRMIISILAQEKQLGIALTGEAVAILVKNKHTVLVEGKSESPKLSPYLTVGAYIINSKEALLDRGDLIIKKSSPTIEETDSLNDQNKIFFTTIPLQDKKLIDKMLKSKISIIDYKKLKKIKKKAIKNENKIAFSNYVLPFILELATYGIKAMVEDEELREGLLIMDGKVYNTRLAALYEYTCYEF